jgi:hypothetical protein
MSARSHPGGKRAATLDFGFDPQTAPHHFVVRQHADGSVLIGERHTWPEEGHAPDPPRPKAVLDAYRWGRLAERAADEFNRRLRADGARAGRWKRGETLLAAHYGKELTLLAWAVEGADPSVIPAMLANWSGLAPEERWWLYTTVNATFTRPEEEPRGWRKAIQIAFAENPVEPAPSALLAAQLPVSAEDRRAAGRRGRSKRAAPEGQGTLDLPGIAEQPPAYDPAAPDTEEDQDQL